MNERFDDRLCGVCARTATGYGYAPNSKKPVMWVCDDPECLKIAKDSYNMKQEEWTRLERLAANEARFDAGDYMARIGKTDMATFSDEEAMTICQVISASYRKNLKKLVGSEAPF